MEIELETDRERVVADRKRTAFFPAALSLSAILHGLLFLALLYPLATVKEKQEEVLYVNLLEEVGEGGSGGNGAEPAPSQVESSQPAPATPQPPQQVAQKEKLPPVFKRKKRIVVESTAEPKQAEKETEPPASAITPATPPAPAASNTVVNSLATASAGAGGPEATGSGFGGAGTGSGTGTGTGFGVGDGTDAGAGLPGKGSSYGRTLAKWLERHKHYPEEARRKGINGNALVRVRIDREGRVLGEEIVRSSGNSILDDAVHQLIARANPFPELPEEVTATHVEFVVPVSFKLR